MPKDAEEIWTQSGKDSRLSDDEVREKYKELIATTTTYHRIRHFTKAVDTFFHFSENLFGGPQLDAPLKSPIFPLGNFRSGTSFLEKVISDHDSIGYFTYTSQVFPRSPIMTGLGMKYVPALNTPMLPIHMPSSVDALSPYEGEPIWRWCKNNPWSSDPINVLGADFSDPAFESLLLRVINKHLISQKKERFINKNPWNTHRVGYLSRLYDDAKFVYIVRHPHRMLRSQIDLVGLHRRTLGHLKNFNDVFSDQFGTPRVFFRTPDSEEFIHRYETDPLRATAMSIVDFDAAFEVEAEKASLKDRILRVRYEDLTADFSSQMRRIFQHVGLLDPEGEAVIQQNEQNYLRKDLISAKSNLPRFDAETEDILKPLADKYDYSV